MAEITRKRGGGSGSGDEGGSGKRREGRNEEKKGIENVAGAEAGAKRL